MSKKDDFEETRLFLCYKNLRDQVSALEDIVEQIRERLKELAMTVLKFHGGFESNG